MVHLIIMTIEHNSVEYITVPFKCALFRDKSNQANNSKMKLELDKANKALSFYLHSQLNRESICFTRRRLQVRYLQSAPVMEVYTVDSSGTDCKSVVLGLGWCNSINSHQYGGLNPTAWVIGCDPMSASSTLVDHPK